MKMQREKVCKRERKKEEKATKRTDFEGMQKNETKKFQISIRMMTVLSGFSRGF